MRVLIALPLQVMLMRSPAVGGGCAGHDEVGAQRAPFLLKLLRPPSAPGRQLLQSTEGAHLTMWRCLLRLHTSILLALLMIHTAPSPAHAYKVTGTVMLRAKTSEYSLPAVVRLALLVPLEGFMEQLQCLPGNCGLFSRNSHCTPLLPNHSRMFAANSLRDPILCAMRL
jgi:hypothetical protein